MSNSYQLSYPGSKINDLLKKIEDINLEETLKNYLTKIPDEYITENELENKGYLTTDTETDPTVPSHVKSITEENISNWNNKSTFSGDYNDLNNKPTIPSADLVAELKKQIDTFFATEGLDNETIDQLYEIIALINTNKGDIDNLTTNKINKETFIKSINSKFNWRGYWNDDAAISYTINDVVYKNNKFYCCLNVNPPSGEWYDDDWEEINLTNDIKKLIPTDEEKSIWNNKSDFSGNYDDLENKPNCILVEDVEPILEKLNNATFAFGLNESNVELIDFYSIFNIVDDDYKEEFINQINNNSINFFDLLMAFTSNGLINDNISILFLINFNAVKLFFDKLILEAYQDENNSWHGALQFKNIDPETNECYTLTIYENGEKVFETNLLLNDIREEINNLPTKEYVDNSLANISTGAPIEFVESEDEMTDNNKAYVLNGNLYTAIKKSYTNWLANSLDIGGTGVFNANGDTPGYMKGYRFSTSSEDYQKANSGFDITGFIPVHPGAIIRLKNIELVYTQGDNSENADSSRSAIVGFKYDNNTKKMIYMNSTQTGSGYDAIKDVLKPGSSFSPWEMEETEDTIVLTMPENSETWNSVTHIRFVCDEIKENAIITVDEEIKDEEKWKLNDSNFNLITDEEKEKLNNLENIDINISLGSPIEFVESEDKMTDTNKAYVLNGNLYTYKNGIKKYYTNVLKQGINHVEPYNSDGSFNILDGKGYRKNSRVNSSGQYTNDSDNYGFDVTGSIPLPEDRSKNIYIYFKNVHVLDQPGIEEDVEMSRNDQIGMAGLQLNNQTFSTVEGQTTTGWRIDNLITDTTKGELSTDGSIILNEESIITNTFNVPTDKKFIYIYNIDKNKSCQFCFYDDNNALVGAKTLGEIRGICTIRELEEQTDGIGIELINLRKTLTFTKIKCSFYLFNTNKNPIISLTLPNTEFIFTGENITKLKIPSNIKNHSDVQYIRLTLGNINDDSVITFNEEIIEEKTTALLDTEYNILSDAQLEMLNSKEGVVPNYWIETLNTATQEINEALCNAGQNKSAFLFYTDAHWNYGSQKSPTLLKYLYQHTGLNKTFFGGDVVNNEANNYDTMKYLWEWRKQLKDLPNHHSVVGNHDDGNTTNNLFNEKYVYGYLQAAEETSDVVRGDQGLYYYIDSPTEKTRYLFLDTAFQSVFNDNDQKEFITNALLTTPNNWHIVAIAHIWYDFNYDDNIIGELSNSGKYLLEQFDDYNARVGEFANCGGTVEFCVGGHTHLDYDGASNNGIPVILCETDSQHVRSDFQFISGTPDEASVNGIIADYDAKKIHVVRAGRGESRVVNMREDEVNE